MVCRSALLVLAAAASLPAWQAGLGAAPAEGKTTNGAAPAAPAASAAPATPAAPVRAGLNGAAAMRNENVQVNLIDNDALKEANIRLGDSVTIVSQPVVETGYYATEHGRPPGEALALRPAPPTSNWHGEIFESLQNSVFNARTFFQVGSVKPSRQNRYGLRFASPMGRLGAFSGSFAQRKSRGMVNGNVLVPLADERTPLATDPAVRDTVARFLAAYPNELPNRLDFDPRALNTNSLQRMDETQAGLRWDREALGGAFAASYSLSRQTIDAFQLVAGQNPDTEIHSHRARMSWTRQLSPSTDANLGLQFNRVKSVLRPEPNAVGPRVRIGYQIEELGPDSQFPIDRAQNTWRWGAVFHRHPSGSRHTFTWGGDAFRLQLNGIETNNSRGLFWFTNNFGRTAIENLRWGTPTTYEGTVGPMGRGFRDWEANAFIGDKWNLSPRFQIYYGLRYNLLTSPLEVNHFNDIPFGCDCNNFSPRFSLAWRAAVDWVVRASYTVSFGGIPGVTYQQVRYNLPVARYLQVQSPYLPDPLRGIDLTDPQARTSPTLLPPDLVSPYAHQYNFSLERPFAAGYTLRAGYVGSRSFKLLQGYILNRAVPMEGIPLTTATVDQRRPDPRYYEEKWVVNGGAAWMDAAQLTVEFPYRKGLTWGTIYTFGKALDAGTDYSGTAANNDIIKGRSQYQYDDHNDKKGLSNFDSTHSLLFFYAWDLPHVSSSGVRGWLARGWQVSGSMLAKTGTPLTLFIGSDAPGFGNVDGGSGERPNVLDPSILGQTIGHPDTAPLILRRDRFAYIVPGQSRGNLGRNAFRKGGIFNCNAALSKQWQWGARAERSVLFRAEAFNLTNHPQFDEPQRNLSSPAFGKITNTLNDGRVLQLGLRLIL
jgi:hypothetical protein